MNVKTIIYLGNVFFQNKVLSSYLCDSLPTFSKDGVFWRFLDQLVLLLESLNLLHGWRLLRGKAWSQSAKSGGNI